MIIGEGPVGKATAIKIAQLADRADRHLNVEIAEKRSRAERAQELGSRAIVVSARTRELFPEIADELTEHGHLVGEFNLYGRLGDNYNGVQVNFRHLEDKTRYNDVLLVPQPFTEKLFREHAEAQGVTINYDTEFVGFVDPNPDDEYVRVLTRDKETGNETITHARYVVGADGARSAVRNALGYEIKGGEGEGPTQHIFLGDLILDNPPEPKLYGSGADGSFAFLAPIGTQDGKIVWRVIIESPDVNASTPLEFGDMWREPLQKIHGTDFGMNEPFWVSRFDVREGLVDDYRGPKDKGLGNVLILGNAAHDHSPAGGQGMNLGIGDGVNAAWKLVSVAAHGADPQLLDTITTERRPAAKEVLASSSTILKIAKGGPAVRRLRGPVLNTALGVNKIESKILGQLSGTGNTYPRERGDHKLVGTRVAPDQPIADEGSLHEIRATHAGQFVAIHPQGQQPPDITGYENRVTVVEGPGDATMLIAPDDYIKYVETPKSRDRALSFGRKLLENCGVQLVDD
jgi:2-polyprenyl-6-methoxyphenol hydroxylase-like FAD-dependent oxidoreductase